MVQDRILDLGEYGVLNSGGTSAGMVIKFENSYGIIKTGRQKIRGYECKFGIEPIIEVIVYEIGKKLNINVAQEELRVAKFRRNSRDVITLVNISKDFKNNMEMLSTEELYRIRAIHSLDIADILKFTSDMRGVMSLAALDIITMQEDRHENNISVLKYTDGYKISPIYDNGYSLGFDDIDKIRMLATGGVDREIEVYSYLERNWQLNSPAFQYRKDYLINVYKKLNDRYIDMSKYMIGKIGSEAKWKINIGIKESTIQKIISEIYSNYKKLSNMYNINNVQLDKDWFIGIEKLIWRRIQYIKHLQ